MVDAAQARLRQDDHRRRAVLRLRPPGQEAPRPRADLGAPHGGPVQDGRRRPPDERRPARRADPGLLRRPRRPPRGPCRSSPTTCAAASTPRNVTVVSPDAGRIRVAEQWAAKLGGGPLAFVHKTRDIRSPNQTVANRVVGDVEGRSCVLVDDLIDTGGTIAGAVAVLLEAGAKDVIVAATHGVLSDPAVRPPAELRRPRGRHHRHPADRRGPPLPAAHRAVDRAAHRARHPRGVRRRLGDVALRRPGLSPMDGRDDEHARRRGPRGGVTVTGSGEAEAVPDTRDRGPRRRGAGAWTPSVRWPRPGCASTGCARSCATPASTTSRCGPRSRAPGPTAPRRGSSRVVARLGLQVTLHDVAVAGDVVGAAVVAGGEPARMDGIRLEISDPTEPRARAREAAWADAVARATQWATLSGRRLGEVQWVTEGGADAAPLRMGRVMGVAKAMSVPVEAGQQTVSADVTVRWAWAETVADHGRRVGLRPLARVGSPGCLGEGRRTVDEVPRPPALRDRLGERLRVPVLRPASRPPHLSRSASPASAAHATPSHRHVGDTAPTSALGSTRVRGQACRHHPHRVRQGRRTPPAPRRPDPRRPLRARLGPAARRPAGPRDDARGEAGQRPVRHRARRQDHAGDHEGRPARRREEHHRARRPAHRHARARRSPSTSPSRSSASPPPAPSTSSRRRRCPSRPRPRTCPTEVEVSIEGLEGGSSVTAGEITLPEGSILLTRPRAHGRLVTRPARLRRGRRRRRRRRGPGRLAVGRVRRCRPSRSALEARSALA